MSLRKEWRKRVREPTSMIGKEGEVSVGFQSDGSVQASRKMDESYDEDHKHKDHKILHVRQMEIQDVLISVPGTQEQMKNRNELPSFHTPPKLPVQTEPPPIFERIETNSRYRDVPELFFLHEERTAESDNNGAYGLKSDGDILSSIMKYTHILGRWNE